jgi:hypothetical protein
MRMTSRCSRSLFKGDRECKPYEYYKLGFFYLKAYNIYPFFRLYILFIYNYNLNKVRHFRGIKKNGDQKWLKLWL